MHPALETRLEVAVEHALAVVLEDLRVGEAAEQRLAHLAAVDPVFCRKSKGLGDRQHAHAGDDLVGRLGHLAGAGSADMHDVLAHAFEGGQGFGKTCIRTAGHDRQRAGDGADLAARHRGIDEIDSGGSEIDADLARGGGGNGAHVDGDEAGCRALRDAAHHFGDIRRIGDHRDHQFVAAGCFGRAGGALCAGFEQRPHRFGAARPDGDGMAALDEIERHRAPHDAEADKGNFHAGLHEVEAPILAEAAAAESSCRPEQGS